MKIKISNIVQKSFILRKINVFLFKRIVPIFVLIFFFFFVNFFFKKIFFLVGGGFINYLKIRFCFFNENLILKFFFYTFIIFWLIYLFQILSDTSEFYFCTSLIEISNFLHLSPSGFF
jgi:hypothetical protein